MVHERLPLDPELLVAQIGWVRSLARNLVRDPAIAEDLEQEAYLAALSAPPETTDAQRLRAWLTRVVRNLSRLRVRGNARREAREADVAREESSDYSVAETVERASVLRLLVDAVMELEEPNRSCVLLRYFEGLSTAEIAVETGASTVAVRKRLSRGLQQLRRRLDAQFDGDRQAWFAALAPLIAPFPVPTAAPAAPVAPTMLTGVGAAPVVVAGALLAMLVLRGSGAEESFVTWPAETDARYARALDDEARIAAPTGERSALGGRASTPGPRTGTESSRPVDLRRGETSSEPPVAEPEAPAADAFAGRLFDLSGTPLAGVDVVAVPRKGPPESAPAARALSGGGGAFELELAAANAAARLEVRADGFTTVRAAPLDPRADEHVVVAAHALPIAGRVVDAAGRPLAGARVERVIPEPLLADVPAPLHRTESVPSVATTGADGRYAVVGVLARPGVLLRASLAGYAELVRPMPAGPMTDLVLVLHRAAPAPWRIAGVVRHADGTPVAGADVWLAGRRTRTDEHGGFELDLDGPPSNDALVVTKPGFHASLLPSVGAVVAGGSAPAELEVVLGGPTLHISGLVVDAQGAPAAGWVVLAAPVEGGSPALTALGESGVKTTVSAVGGAFRLADLEAGAYEIHAFDPVTHALASGGVLSAGASAAFVKAPLERGPEALEGRLKGGLGETLEGAELSVVLPLAGGAVWRVPGAAAVTGADGGFALSPVPPAGAKLHVSHPAALGATQALPAELAGARLHDLFLETDRTFQLRGWSERVDSVLVLDAEGAPLVLHGPETSEPRAPVLRGTSSVLTVSGRARTAVLLRGEQEFARVPLDLAPRGVTLVEP